VLSLIVSGCTGAAGGPAATPTSGAAGSATTGAGPQGADPQLASIYSDFVQKEMPGVPFSVLEGAKKEGAVVWYLQNPADAANDLVEAFKKTFPFVEVQQFVNTGGPTLERYLSEKRARQNLADVVMLASLAHVNQVKSEGFIENYKVAAEPKFKPGTYESGVWYPIAIANLVYLYNTNLVTEEQASKLTKYDSLWDPGLASIPKGIQNAAASTTSLTLFYYFDKTYGRDSWTKLKTANAKVYEPLPTIDALARGEVGITYASESLAITQFNNGAPLRWRVPEPVFAQPYATIIAKDAPHPNAARLFQEFIMTKPGQTVYQAKADTSARTDVPDGRAVVSQPWFKKAEERQIEPPIDPVAFGAVAPKLVEDWKAVFTQ
jgi:ABC-type Fe3+ transport system substrate-binding protein